MNRLKIKTGDILIIVFFLFIGFAGFIFNIKNNPENYQKYILVTVDNFLVKEISVNENDEDLISFNFGTNNEYEAFLEVKDGMVRMLPIDKNLCPRGICSHTGWISDYNEMIACLPNRILISIDYEDKNIENDVDGITR